MEEKDIQGILKKVEELRAFFTFSNSLIPFLEETLLFVQEMEPMLSEMNKSFQESSSKMPGADQQLDKVPSAPEIATHEMLDKIDDMLGKVDELSNVFSQINTRLKAEKEAVAGISSTVEQLLKLPEARKTLSQLFDNEKARELGVKVKEIVDDFLAGSLEESVAEKADQLLHDTQADAHNIMNALQVQDITTQQIEAAHSLLRSVQERLNTLISKYSEAELPEILREEGAVEVEAEKPPEVTEEAGVAVEEEAEAEPVAEIEEKPEPTFTMEEEAVAEAEAAEAEEEAGVAVEEEAEAEPEAAEAEEEAEAAVEEEAEAEPEAAEAEEEAEAAVEEEAEAEPEAAEPEEEKGSKEEKESEKKGGDEEISISQEEIDKLFE